MSTTITQSPKKIQPNRVAAGVILVALVSALLKVAKHVDNNVIEEEDSN